MTKNPSIATTLNVELLRRSIPSSIDNDIIVEESQSKEYDTVEKRKDTLRKGEYNRGDHYGSIASSATGARKGTLQSVDRTLDSVGYEAVDVLNARNISRAEYLHDQIQEQMQ